MPDDAQMKKTTRVLFSIVGMRDPYPKPEELPGQLPDLGAEGTLYDFEGSVLTVCRKVRPDILYLFPSGKAKATPPDNHTEGRAEAIEAIVKGWTNGPRCERRPLDVTNPANVEEVYGCFQGHVLAIIDKLAQAQPNGLEAYEFFVDTTSGTPQMSEAVRLCLATNLPLEPTYCQSFDPARFQGGERVVFPKPLLPELVLLKQIDNNIEGYQFHSLIGDCTTLIGMTKLRKRQAVAGILQNVFWAYEKMDFMQYGEAYAKISRVHGYDLPQINAIMQAQEDFLEHVRDERVAESVYSLVDLYFNMERAFARGNYVDVLARFWRLREGMMYYRLLKKHGIDKHALLTNSDQASLEKLRNSDYTGYIDWKKGQFRTESLDILNDMIVDVFDDNELDQFNQERQNELDHLRLVRNKTIVAHGMAPVQEEEAEMCLKIGKDKIIELIPEVPEIPGAVPRIPGGQEIYDAYPFTLANLRTLADMLKRA